MANMSSKAEDLRRKITGAMIAIKNGTKTPKETGVGAHFKALHAIDEAAHSELIKEYAPIVQAWKDKQEDLHEESISAMNKKVNGTK